jgi:hypothetical protein
MNATHPTYGYGGESAKAHLADLIDAAHALRAAHKAVQNAYPNARGFITRPADFNVAQDDHVRRCRHIEDVLAEIEALAIGASDACR